MTQQSKQPRDQDQDSSGVPHHEDYIDDAHPGEDRDNAVVDEQGEESFPASDPPANY